MAITTSRIGDAQKPPKTTCKICFCSIFREDETKWVTSPNPGLAHKICVEEEPPPRAS